MSTINLLPDDYVRERSEYRGNFLCVVLYAAVVVGLGGASLISERACRNTRQVCDRINAAYADAARLIDEVHQLEAQKRRMLQKAQMSASLMERLPRSYVLATLTNALPKGASIDSLEMKVQAVQPGAAVVRRPRTKFAAVARARAQQSKPASTPNLAVTLNIKGRASTDVEVARFIASLAQHDLMEMVDLSYSKQAGTEKRSKREFRLVARLRPNADALDAMAGAAKAQAAPAQPHDTPPAGGGA